MTRLFRILAYHSINEPDNASIYTRNITSAGNFEAHMRYLSKYFYPVPLSTLTNAIENRSWVKQNTVAVTFDDGYADFYWNAYPILRKYRIPATIFLSTAYIVNNEVKWDDKLSLVLKSFQNEQTFIDWFNSHFPGFKVKGFGQLTWSLQRMHPKHVNALMDQIERVSDNQCRTRTMMSVDELRNLANDDMIEFGSHTCSHPNMTLLERRNIARELRDSREIIKSIVGRDVNGFSYPYGIYNGKVKEAVREEGYKYAVTCDEGFNTSHSDPYGLERILIVDDPVESFQRRLSTFRFWLKTMKRLLAKNKAVHGEDNSLPYEAP